MRRLVGSFSLLLEGGVLLEGLFWLSVERLAE
jgi:hypothetical protein